MRSPHNPNRESSPPSEPVAPVGDATERTDAESPAWKDVRALFEEVVELPPGGRAAFLDARAERGSSLRNAVERLVAQDGIDDGMLDQPLAVISSESGITPLGTGTRIGPYTLLGVIASGGMGTVYKASQESPRKLVAIKTIRPSSNPELIKRFRFEAEVLGQLRHPGIADIYEFATADLDSGRIPYFAMEFVAGAKDLVSYARDAERTTHERLSLFLLVCDAIHHAHQNGIIHRDLKPNNILVDGRGHPRVIDFGLAVAEKAIDLAVSRAETMPGQVLGTLQYMSPEQLKFEGRPPSDVATDIYALGVILFELLAESPPFDLKTASLLDAVRILDSKAAPLRQFKPSLAGDLEWIVQKAMDRDRSRRYASVSELAADIQRFLQHVPVLAGPPSGWYRVRKAVRRHRWAFGAISGIAVALIAGLITTLVQLNEKNTQFEVANETLGFLDRMFDSIDPRVAMGEEVTVREFLAKAKNELESGRLRSREAEARLQLIIGRAYRQLGDPVTASDPLARAWAGYREFYGEYDERSLECLNAYASSLLEVGDMNRARALTRKAFEISKVCVTLDHHEALVATLNQASLLTDDGDPQGAEVLLDEVLGRNLDPPFRRAALNGKLAVQEVLGRWEKLLEITRQIDSERLEQSLGHPDVIEDRRMLGVAISMSGDLEGAIATFEELLPPASKTLTDDHPLVVGLKVDLAYTLLEAGRGEESREQTRRVVDHFRSIRGTESREHLTLVFKLGSTLISQAAFADAVELLQWSLEAHLRLGLEETLSHFDTKQALAQALFLSGRMEESEAHFHAVIEEMTRLFPEDHSSLAKARMGLAGLYAQTGQFHKGHTLMSMAYQSLQRTTKGDEPLTQVALRNLAFSHIELGNWDEAFELLDPLVKELEGQYDESSQDRLDAELALCWLLGLQGKLDEAESRIRSVRQRYQSLYSPKNPVMANVDIHCIEILIAQEKDDEAIELAFRRIDIDGFAVPFLAQCLGKVLIRVGRTVEAKSILEKSLATARRVLSPTHFSIPLIEAALGECLLDLGEYEEGERLILESWETLSDLLGSDHWRTIRVEELADTI